MDPVLNAPESVHEAQPEPKSYLTTDNPQNLCEGGTKDGIGDICCVVTISARSCMGGSLMQADVTPSSAYAISP